MRQAPPIPPHRGDERRHRAAGLLWLLLAAACAGAPHKSPGAPAGPPASVTYLGPTVRVEVERWTAADWRRWNGPEGDTGEQAGVGPGAWGEAFTVVLELADRPPPMRVCPRGRPPSDPLADPTNWAFSLVGAEGTAAARATVLGVDEFPGPGDHRSLRLVYAVLPASTVDATGPVQALLLQPVSYGCRRRYGLGRPGARYPVAVPTPFSSPE